MRSGVDIVSIPRMEKAARSLHFRSRVFTEGELADAFSKKYPFRRLAASFAAKEACLKALSPGNSEGLRWKDIELTAGGDGRPLLRLHSQAKKHLGERKPFLSLAFPPGFALAFVVIE